MKNLIDRFDCERISRLYESQDYENCLKAVKKVSSRLGNSSPWLSWIRGVCEDMTGNPLEALLFFKEALVGDPYNYYYMSSLSTSLMRIKNILVSYLDNEGTLEEVKQLHSFLVEAGEFSTTHQYLIAKNYILRSEFKEARNVLTPYLMNNPNDGDALALESMIDGAIGNALAS